MSDEGAIVPWQEPEPPAHYVAPANEINLVECPDGTWREECPPEEELEPEEARAPEPKPARDAASPKGTQPRPSRAAASRRGGIAVPAKKSTVARTLKGSTFTGESRGVRFIDGLITGGVAAATVLWTATRPTEGQQLGWGAFWCGLGLLMGVQGTHELRYGGFGVGAANAAYLSLRLFHPNLAGQ